MAAASLATALAFGLRVGRLEFQSLWYDEGSSVFLSQQPLAAITNGAAADIHPPLYYYLLHFWTDYAGTSEFGLRFLSLVAGVLILPLLFVIGRWLFDARAGLVAALAGAISPLLVYYSQETRMYAQVTLFGLLSTYLLLRALNKQDWRLWLWYAAAIAACLYSQYIGALALAFQGIYVLVRYPRQLVRMVPAAALAVLAFVPWVIRASDSLLHWPSSNAFQAGPAIFGDAAFRYVFGLSADVTPLTIGHAVVGALLALAGALAFQRRWLAVLYVVVPVGAMFALGYRTPIYNPKFALLALPGYLLLVGAGIAALPRVAATAGAAVMLAGSGIALANYYGNSAFQRDDYRSVAQYVTTSQREGDAVILNAPGQIQIFPYYYNGGLPLLGLPTDRPLSKERTDQQLTAALGGADRLWMVLYGTNGSDPDGYVEQWLAGHSYEVLNQWFGNVRLTEFAPPSGQQGPKQPADATFGDFAHLTAYQLAPPTVISGDVLELKLNWQVAGQPVPGIKVFTHLIDGDGNIWAQRDSDPVGGARPTQSWKPGETIEDNYGLPLLPGTPPGTYQIEVGAYNVSTGARLALTQGGHGDRLILGQVKVTIAEQAPSLAELRISHLLPAQPAALEQLLGYGLTLVGQDAERTSFRTDDELHLSLFWQAAQQDPTAQTVTVRIGGRTVASRQLLPGLATSLWRPGERYLDQYKIKLAPGVAGGDMTVQVGGGAPIKLASISIANG